MARPEEMAKYQRMVPGAPERIFCMAESRTVDASKRLDKSPEFGVNGVDVAHARSLCPHAGLRHFTTTVLLSDTVGLGAG